jgi:hypothetical protein
MTSAFPMEISASLKLGSRTNDSIVHIADRLISSSAERFNSLVKNFFIPIQYCGNRKTDPTFLPFLSMFLVEMCSIHLLKLRLEG